MSTVATGFLMGIERYKNQIPLIYIQNKRLDIFHQFQATRCVSVIFCTVSTLWERFDESFSLHNKDSKYQVFQIGIFFDEENVVGKEFVYISFAQKDYVYHHLRIDVFFKTLEDSYQISVRFIPQQGKIKRCDLRDAPLLVPISHTKNFFHQYQTSLVVSAIHVMAANAAIIESVIQFENYGDLSFLATNHASTKLVMFILSTYLNTNVHLSRGTTNGEVFVHYAELLLNYCHLYDTQTPSAIHCITSLPVWKYLYGFSETVHNLKKSPSDLNAFGVEISVDKHKDLLRRHDQDTFRNLKFDQALKADTQFDFKTSLQTIPFQTVIQSQSWFSNVNACDVFGMNNGMMFFLDVSNNVITRDQLFSHAQNRLSETYGNYATDSNKYTVTVNHVEYVYDVAKIKNINDVGTDVDANTPEFELQGILVMQKQQKPLFYNPKKHVRQVSGNIVYAIMKFHNGRWYNCLYEYSGLSDTCMKISEPDIDTVYYRKPQIMTNKMQTTDIAYVFAEKQPIA